MPIGPALGTTILVLTVLFSGQAQAVKVDTTVNDWEFAFSRSAKSSQAVKSGQDLMLVNRHIGIPFAWGRTGTFGGINLKWATGKRLKDFKRGKKLRLVRIVSRRKGQLRYGDRVAVYIHHRTSDGHYLKYKKRSYGINLVWSKKPRYEFELQGGTKGLTIRTQNPVALYNHVERDALIYCERSIKGKFWVKWAR